MIIYSKQVCTLDGIVEAYVKIKDGKIISIDKSCDSEFIDYSNLIIMPGYIDIHIHGWANGSFWMEKTPESIWKMQEHLPKCGVTSFLATTGADSIEETCRSIEAANIVYLNQKKGADFLGVHMEGPFISKEYKGLQQEEHCIEPNINLMERFYNLQDDKSMIKLMTLAPELNNAKELIKYNKERKIQNSIGHSGASFDCIKELKQYGLGGVTHMFSGMKAFHHRELSVVGAALYFDDLYCEFAKQTGMTVKHEAFDFVYRLKSDDKVYLTTDCQGIARTQKPFYHYIRGEKFEPDNGKLKITKDSGEIEFIDPDDYDSVKDLEVSYEDSVKNMLKHTNMDLISLSKITSLNPAKYIGVDNKKGSIEIGKDADIIALDSNFNVIKCYCKGIEY
ncbi:N-acetylglucosamine-6-phosphate deacetylase [Miniphocaeibacter halophilus]|uniref:N-acetylglucosamine-6-phosphate deacetylase n=1 Tax=Miniphocaeibacter halophilus TaxID=2931922 RepID=A0AC61MV86_9FIRM|nr:N-acetylglucosamine-6-phosphate deacetylase [Miniphocaeibacter halophilus]QQK08026.1 N-acetylglucosamine-6-phosphate deacetylase [Miniphocaeibacter halophilus]